MSDLSISGQSGMNQIRLRVQSQPGQARITGYDGMDPVDIKVKYDDERSSVEGLIGTKFVQLQRLGSNLTGRVDGNTFRGNHRMIVDVERSGQCDLNPLDYIVAFGQY